MDTEKPQDSLRRFWADLIKVYENQQLRELRVGVVTSFTNNYNYGAILQAYALTRFIGVFTRECKQINYSGTITASRATPIRNECAAPSPERREAVQGIAARKQAMNRFMRRIPQTHTVFSDININEAVKAFDAFVCGSDVIWGTQTRLNQHPFYWLDFVPKGNKIKISYAPSLKTKDWTPYELRQIVQYTSTFDALSVREEDGKAFLEGLLRRTKRVTHALDPTLLIPTQTWRYIAKRANVENDYIFVYLLGDSVAQRRRIREFAKLKGLPIVTLPHCVKYRRSDASFGDVKLYDIDPPQWIWLIDHAEYIFTDSFHGALFSSMFHKRFFILNREMPEAWSSLGNRITSLTNMWGIGGVVLPDEGSAYDIDRIPPIDYRKVDEATRVKRIESAEFLLSALESGCRRLGIGTVRGQSI